MSRPALEQTVVAAAQAKGGLITLAELRALGANKRELRSWRTKRTLIELLPKVYRPAAIPDAWDVRARAVLRWGGPRAALCHVTAAAIMGFPGYERTGPIHVAVPGTRRVPAPEELELVAHCSRVHTRWDVREIDGFRVTSPERTLFDLAADLEDATLEHLVDDAIINRRATPHGLKACFRRLAKSGRKGTVTLGAVLERRAKTLVVLDSHLESEFLQLFDRLQLPIPRTRTPSPTTGRPDYYIDFAYPQWRLAIEIQSKKHHWGTTKQYEDDEKANVLTSRGWSVLRLWAKDKFDPTRVRRHVRNAIAVRAPIGAIDYAPDVPPDVDMA
ncbi:MAG TPA: DUF559 domain-containing protein [Myxococcaceae bacterium]|nr:DUF559 domain-containing protein [Myxococcaceae bacterium]